MRRWSPAQSERPRSGLLARTVVGVDNFAGAHPENVHLQRINLWQRVSPASFGYRSLVVDFICFLKVDVKLRSVNKNVGRQAAAQY